VTQNAASRTARNIIDRFFFSIVESKLLVASSFNT